MKIVFTADLHLEHSNVPTIARFVTGIDGENPDAVILAGDLGSPPHLFEECLAQFTKLPCPVLVLPGNHDLWVDSGDKSDDLYEQVLPAITASFGFHWLEGEPFRLGNVGIAGSIAWYDYSSRDAGNTQTDDEILAIKPKVAMDAMKVLWPHTDKSFAAECRQRLHRQMESLEADRAVERILVATHVPPFPCQMDFRPHDLKWTIGNPFFGHFTLGEELRRYAKISWVFSGHTHVGKSGNIQRDGAPPFPAVVIDSDYGRPRWITIET